MVGSDCLVSCVGQDLVQEGGVRLAPGVRSLGGLMFRGAHYGG